MANGQKNVFFSDFPFSVAHLHVEKKPFRLYKKLYLQRFRDFMGGGTIKSYYNNKKSGNGRQSLDHQANPTRRSQMPSPLHHLPTAGNTNTSNTREPLPQRVPDSRGNLNNRYTRIPSTPCFWQQERRIQLLCSGH